MNTRVRLDVILDLVCRHFAVSRRDMLSDRRTGNLTIPRQTAWWLAHDLTPLSYPTIGRCVRRHHSTVMYGVSRAAERMAADPEYAAWVATLQAALAPRVAA